MNDIFLHKNNAMILGFMTKWPDGMPTDFVELILNRHVPVDVKFMNRRSKIHTIRSGHRWEAGMKLHMATGVRTKNYEQFNKGIEALSTCKSAIPIFMTYYRRLEISIGTDEHNISCDRVLNQNEIYELIMNDGINDEERFDKYFYNAIRKHKDKHFSGQIVSWTNFKY